MKKIKINISSAAGAYPIVIGSQVIKYLPEYFRALRLPEELFVITNNYIKSRYALTLKGALKNKGFSVEFYSTIDSEKAKSFANAERIVEALAGYAAQKKITVVAFGGGVVGDLASFIASIYKRGVPLIHIPTTLLAQIDSSAGGKTAIDLRIAKNMVGTFYHPRAVFCDIDFLLSLDKRALRAGLAEAVKYAAIRDEKLFSFLEENYHSIFSKDRGALEYLVCECLKIKARIVESDEREEKGLRTLLNFGHTIGHAVEAAGKYENYTHGEAVALGMLAASKMSLNMGMVSSRAYQRIVNLIANIGLPQEISGIKEEDVLKAYRLDKKFIGRTNRFVLLKDIGKPLVRQNVPEKIIFNAIRELFVS